MTFRANTRNQSVSSMIDYLLNKFQPQMFTSNKKDAIKQFEGWFFTPLGQSYAYTPQEVYRLLCGTGKKTGLLHACGSLSKKTQKLQKSALLALDLLCRLCSKEENKEWECCQKVFVTVNQSFIDLMSLDMHESGGNREGAVYCKQLLTDKDRIVNGQPMAAPTQQSSPAPVSPGEPAVRTNAPPAETRPIMYKEAKDAEGNTYYYHAKTRETSWDRPEHFPYDQKPPDPVSAAFVPASAPKPPAAFAPVAKSYTSPNFDTERKDGGGTLFSKSGGIFAMLANLFASRSTQEELVSKGVIKIGSTFGQVLERQCEGQPDGIPVLIRELTQFMRPNIVKLHGVFRVSGDSMQIADLKKLYDYSFELPRDFMSFGSHAISGALKLYLRELPDPLFTWEAYDPLVDAFRVTDLEKTNEIIQGLPAPNLATWNYLLDFLVRVTHFQETNMMSAKNVAIVFAPNLVRLKIETFEKIARDTPVTVGLVEYLILERAKIVLKDPDEKSEADADTMG